MDKFGEELFDVFKGSTSSQKKRKRNDDDDEITNEKNNQQNFNNNDNNTSDSEEVSDLNEAPPPSKIQRVEENLEQPSAMEQLEQRVTAIETRDSINDSATTQQNLLENNENNDNNKSQSSITTLPHLNVPRDSCFHSVALPNNWEGDYPKESVKEMESNPSKYLNAKKYKFTLDPFQIKSIAAIESFQSVLVSAHTSAGKTAVAEYAIAKAIKDNQKVIYTSPIKALSNQKYRELNEEFSDVGLITGDVTLSPNASVLVMTTEILRSMIYRGAQILREVAWIVFDEIHYIRDKERGVVWEETIIMLPHGIRHVFLSATIPNATEFAEWIAHLHHQPVHVVATEFRPTPLQHYAFPIGGQGIHLVVDENGRFIQNNLHKALLTLNENNSSSSSSLIQKTNQENINNNNNNNNNNVSDKNNNIDNIDKNKNGKQNKSSSKKATTNTDVKKLVRMIVERNFEPAVFFSFSRRECEMYAMQISDFNLNDESEKELVEQVFNNAVDLLSETDKKLSPIVNILPLLKKGIAIHHSGLLPILKELVEILFQEGLIKCLFTTETFALGLNMPARTVVFTSVKKFDGHEFRYITSGEYIQMSGRAGRRGIDKRGLSIMMLDHEVEPDTIKTMIGGTADTLMSAFHLSYNMILNLLRVEGIDPEFIMHRSFYHFQQIKAKPKLEKQLQDLKRQHSEIEIADEENVGEFYRIKRRLLEMKDEFQEEITKPLHCLPFIQPGRIVHVVDGEEDWGWGIVVNFQKQSSSGGRTEITVETRGDKYIVDVLLECRILGPDVAGLGRPHPAVEPGQGEMVVLPVQLRMIQELSSVLLFLPKDLRPQENRESVRVSLDRVREEFPDGFPLLDPIEDMDIDSPKFRKLIRKIETKEYQYFNHPLYREPEMKPQIEKYGKKMRLEDEIDKVKEKIRSSSTPALKSTLKHMLRVLRRLGYINSDNIIQVKGRVACEIDAGDELVATELIFSGLFNDLTPEQCVALLSCLVCQERSESAVTLREELQLALYQLQDTARRVASVAKESKIDVDEDEFVAGFRSDLMEVVYAWCKGSKFADVCRMTDIFEGNIVRAVRRLEELIRQMRIAAKSIGDTNLEEKFDTGSKKIRRDIVFAASLYL